MGEGEDEGDEGVGGREGDEGDEGGGGWLGRGRGRQASAGQS